MPRVPVYDQRQIAPQPLPTPQRTERVSPEAFGDGIGRGLQVAGGVIADIAERDRQQSENAALLEADNALDVWEQSAVFDPENGAYAKRGKDAFDLPNQVLPNFDKEADRLEGAMGSERARQAFRARTLQRRQQISERLNLHEFKERETFYDDQDKAKLASSRVMAGNYYNDPERIAGEILAQDQVIAAHGARKGWPSEQVKQAQVESRSGTHVDVVNRYIARGEWRKGQIYFEEIKDQIGGDDGTRIEAALTAERRRAEAEAKEKLTEARQALNDEVRDIMAAAELGIPVTEAPSRNTLTAVFGEREGEQRHRIVQLATRVAGEISELNHLPSGELLTRAQDFKPTQVEGAADQAIVYNTVQRSAARILEQRQQDPVGYLTQNSVPVQAAWTALGEATGAEQPAAAQAYLRTVRAERERLGLAGTDLLPETYAASVADEINGAPTAEAMTSAIEREAERWGQAWPQVYGQVAPKMTGAAAVIGSGIPPAAASALATMSKMSEKDLTALLPPGNQWSQVEQAVDEELADFRRSFAVDGFSTYTAFRDAATRLTAKYMQQGSGRSEAAAQAYRELVSDRYEIIDFRAAAYRVPRERNTTAVAVGAGRSIANYELDQRDIIVPLGSALTDEEYLGQWQAYVREHGYWITSPDDMGLRLYVDGGPVEGPVDVPWSTLESVGVDARRPITPPTAEQLRGFGGRGQ